MSRHARHCEARDQHLALSAHHGGLLVRASLRRVVHHLSHHLVVHGGRMTYFLSNAIVVVAIAISLGYACWRLGPRATLRAQLRKYFPHYFAAPTVTASGCGG